MVPYIYITETPSLPQFSSSLGIECHKKIQVQPKSQLKISRNKSVNGSIIGVQLSYRHTKVQQNWLITGLSIGQKINEMK